MSNKKTVKDIRSNNEVKVEKDVKKRFLRGGYSTLMIAIVVAIVIVLNIVASFVETGLGLKLDLTQNKLYTLSPQTENIVKDIDKDLTIYSFANDNKQDIRIEKTIERYAALNNRITVKVVDPARDVNLQRKFSTESVTIGTNTIVVTDSSEKIFRIITANDMIHQTTDQTGSVTGQYWVLEQKLTSAFMFMADDEQTNVYLLTGHGELVKDPSKTGAVNALIERLEEENYNVDYIDLAFTELRQGDILMVVGPRSDLSEQERDTIIEFLDNKGKALFFFDPSDKELPNFAAVLDHYMIKIKNQTICETDNDKHRGSSFLDITPSIVSGDITEGIVKMEYNVFVDNSLYFEEYTYDSDNADFYTLLKTSESSLGIPSADLVGDAYKNKLNDYVKESRIVGFAYKKQHATSMQNDAQTRICAFGSSDVALDYQNFPGNVTLIKNCVNWVNNETDKLAINGPEIDYQNLTITNASTVTTLVTVAIIVIPLIIIGGGIFIWFRRKNL